MYRIESKYTMDESIEKLDRALIHYNPFALNVFGYVGKLDKNDNSLWIANHSNIYRTRAGYRYRTYRRFEGDLTKSMKGATVYGSFRIRPLFKISLSIYFIGISFMSMFGILFSTDLFTVLKLVGMLIFMIIGGLGVIKFNLKKTEESEKEIIEFIEDVLGYNDEIITEK